MNNYKYSARDFTGQRKEGLKQAPSANEVLNWLREQGYTPVSITELSQKSKKVVRKGKIIERYFASGKMKWDKFDEVELPNLPDEVYAGIFCLSHDNNQLAKAVFRNIKLTKK